MRSLDSIFNQLLNVQLTHLKLITTVTDVLSAHLLKC